MLPLISEADWESLCCLCPNAEHQSTLREYIQALTPEWYRCFGSCYPDGEVQATLDLNVRSSLTTGILKINKTQYQYGAVLKISVRDPLRYYTTMTRFITVYMSENLEPDTIKRSSIEPLFSDEFYHQGSVKK